MFSLLKAPSKIRTIQYLTQKQAVSEDNIRTDQLIIENLSDIGMLNLIWEGRRMINTKRLSVYTLPKNLMEQLETLSHGISEPVELIKQIETYLPVDETEDFVNKIHYHVTSFQMHVMFAYMIASLMAVGLVHHYNVHTPVEGLYSAVVIMAILSQSLFSQTFSPLPETPREEKLVGWRLKQQRELKIQEQVEVWKEKRWIKAIAQVSAYLDTEYQTVSCVNILAFLGMISLNWSALFEQYTHYANRLRLCALVTVSVLHIYEILNLPHRFETIKHRHENAIAEIPVEIQQSLMDIYEAKTTAWNRRLNKFLVAIGCAETQNAVQRPVENVIAPQG